MNRDKYGRFIKGHKDLVPKKSREKASKSMLGNKNHFFGKHHTKETIEKIRNMNLGKHRSLKTEIKKGQHLSIKTEFFKGIIPFCKIHPECMPKGENVHNWKGNNVGYTALHDWVRRYLGKPTKCEHCGTTTAKRFEWANKSRKYLRNEEDWIRLCKSCHIKYDKTK